MTLYVNSKKEIEAIKRPIKPQPTVAQHRGRESKVQGEKKPSLPIRGR